MNWLLLLLLLILAIFGDLYRVDTVSKGQEKFAIFKKSQGMSGKVRKSQGMNSDSQ